MSVFYKERNRRKTLMLTMIISLALGVLVFASTRFGAEFSTGWAVACAILSMFIFQLAAALLIRRAVNARNLQIQAIIMDVQKRLEAKQQHFMRHPLGSQKIMMQQLEQEQTAGLERALAACDIFKPLYIWNFLLAKQINTMKMAFLFQLKRFDDVDAIMPKCLFLEPQAVCMKMVRLYKKNDPALDKFFRKKGATLKKDNCVLPALLYAWILLKQGKNDDAFTVLTNAKKKSENPVLVANWEALANGKIKQFSNAGLGEAWYALGLEMPKMQRVQQQPQYRYR